MEKEYLNLKLTIKMLTFQLSLFLEVYLMDLVMLSLMQYLYEEISLNVYDVQVNYNSVDKSGVFTSI